MAAEPASDLVLATGGRLVRVELETGGAVQLSPIQEAERARAIADLQAEASFAPISGAALRVRAGDAVPAFALHLSVARGRLVFDVRHPDGTAIVAHGLSLVPFRSLVRDYSLLVSSYEAAVEEGRGERLQAIDMGRRGLHDEGARLVIERLAGKIALDHATARRLFTLICVLYQRD
jgi:uncharacterized protein (UPF0262 family)